MITGLQKPSTPVGDIYFKQKDYFNAKATFQSVVEITDPELKSEAQEKWIGVMNTVKSSKVGENWSN